MSDITWLVLAVLAALLVALAVMPDWRDRLSRLGRNRLPGAGRDRGPGGARPRPRLGAPPDALAPRRPPAGRGQQTIERFRPVGPARPRTPGAPPAHLRPDANRSIPRIDPAMRRVSGTRMSGRIVTQKDAICRVCARPLSDCQGHT